MKKQVIRAGVVVLCAAVASASGGTRSVASAGGTRSVASASGGTRSVAAAGGTRSVASASLEAADALRRVPPEASAAEGFDCAAFTHPPAEYSPGYFWMWKAKLDADLLCRQLDDMAANDIRAVCVHPFPKGFRPGSFTSEMEPDYLTDAYLEILKKVCAHASRLGMNFWLYDEGGWPSGGACGLVAASDREGRFRKMEIGPAGDGKNYALTFRPYGPGGASHPSPLEKGATARFLELTHDALYARLKDSFGGAIKFAFTDEPEWGRNYFGGKLGWCRDFADEFLRRKGYDILPHMGEIVNRQYDYVPELVEKRIDYYEVISDLFVERYLLPIRDWCRAHGIRSSGHLNGEDLPEWSRRYGHGNLLKSLRAMDAPGVDVIWRQLWPASSAGAGAQRPFPRYAASAANQIGSPYVMSETFGIFGASLTPGEMKWLMDYQLVRGVNQFVFGYYAMDYAGQWMTLFEPQSGPITPLWAFEAPYFRYIHRVAAFLASGARATETAVFYDARAFFAGGPETDIAAEAHYGTARILDRRHVDYDFIDDDPIIAAPIEDGALVVGPMRYRTLVVPSDGRMKAATRAKLAAFQKAGGRLLAPADLARAKPVCDIRGPFAFDMRATKRVKGNEALYFIVNETPYVRALSIAFEEPGDVVCCEAVDGTFTRVAKGAEGRISLTLEGFGSRLFLVGSPTGGTRSVASASGGPRSVAAADAPVFAQNPALTIRDGWTVQKLTTHFAGRKGLECAAVADAETIPVRLGDWRDTLGDHFSGTARYRVTFDWAGGETAQLDLGEVAWACSVKLNGQTLAPKFFGPFAWIVQPLHGRNTLDVTVANTLANALSDDAVRRRIARDFPPSCASYEPKQSVYDKENNVSGLLGPVTLRARVR